MTNHNNMNLLEERYGRLLVIERLNSVRGNRYWKCLCDCGNIACVSTGNLRAGHVTSCGCYQREKMRRPKGQAMFNRTYYTYKSNAKNRDILFDISKEDFYRLSQLDCFYCGSVPSNISKRKLMNGEFIYNGLDRIDSSKGYTLDNVVPCCGRCNEAKMEISYKEFKNWIFKVSDNLISKEIQKQTARV